MKRESLWELSSLPSLLNPLLRSDLGNQFWKLTFEPDSSFMEKKGTKTQSDLKAKVSWSHVTVHLL